MPCSGHPCLAGAPPGRSLVSLVGNLPVGTTNLATGETGPYLTNPTYSEPQSNPLNPDHHVWEGDPDPVEGSHTRPTSEVRGDLRGPSVSEKSPPTQGRRTNSTKSGSREDFAGLFRVLCETEDLIVSFPSPFWRDDYTLGVSKGKDPDSDPPRKRSVPKPTLPSSSSPSHHLRNVKSSRTTVWKLRPYFFLDLSRP